MKIEALRLFHITRKMPYNSHPPMSEGQVLAIGEAHNPFFAFYEQPRAYPVDLPTGRVMVPAVSFLRQVRDGQIAPGNLPVDAFDIAQHYVMLVRELLMEEVRAREFPDLPSRQTCLWTAATIEGARFWLQRLGGHGQIVEIEATGTIHTADANLLLGDSEPLSQTYARARSYWRGEMTEKSECETLFCGAARVVSVSSI